MDKFIIRRLFRPEGGNGSVIFIDYNVNHSSANDLTENKSFNYDERRYSGYNTFYVKKSSNFSINNNNGLEVRNINLKYFLETQHIYDIGNTAVIKNIKFESKNKIILKIETNGTEYENITLDKDRILEEQGLLKKESNIYKFKVDNVFLEIAGTDEFGAVGKECSISNYNNLYPLEVNVNDSFISIKKNEEYFRQSFILADEVIHQTGSQIVNYLIEKDISSDDEKQECYLPLILNNSDSSFEKPLTVLKNGNKELKDFKDFFYRTTIKNMTVNKSKLIIGGGYTGSDVICNVTFTFKIEEANKSIIAQKEEFREIISLIANENGKKIKEEEDYTLTFDLCLAGDSSKNFYSLVEIANNSNKYFIYRSDIKCVDNNATLVYTYDSGYDYYDSDTFYYYLGFVETYTVGILIETSEQDYSAGLKKLVRNFIKKYSIEKQDPTETETATTFLEEDKFYNHIAGGMPRVEVTFVKKNYKDKTNDLNASNPTTEYKYVTGLCPYIKSMSLTDNGVKKLKLVLWDRDFGSYNSSEKPLEQVIREAIAYNSCNPEAKEENKKQGPENDSDVNSVSYLDIVKIDTNSDTTNLKLRFGFDDYNIPLTSGNRSNRAWELIKSEEEKSDTIIFNPYYNVGQNGLVVNKPKYNENENFFTIVDTPIGAPIKDDETNPQEEEQQQKKEKNINRQRLVNKSADQTTRLSLEMEFMIVGYKTSLQKNGIAYEIEAIESNSIKTLNYSILQRFEDITGTPSEVLYTLMRLFNENADGVLNRNAPKIYFDNDDIVEEVDKEAYRNTSIAIPEKADASTINKKISISLGGQNSYYNYNETDSDEQHIRYYKNIGSLISEFCAACPPKKEVKRSAKTYIDKSTAETVTIENNSEGIFRPLQWYVTDVPFTVEGQEKPEKIPCIFLYYRRVNKINKIRKYNWGPGLAGKNSVILDLQIENANEFAVMSAVSVFNLEDSSSTTVSSNTENTGGIIASSNLKDTSGITVNRVTGGAITNDAYENAYNNCLYQGSITILGDPFYTFDNFLQPCSYPIYLNIEVPVSEYELRNKVENNIYFNKVNNNVRKHYLSGYYVVKSITHNITDGNFTTTLEIMSYPGIANDINVVTKQS